MTLILRSLDELHPDAIDPDGEGRDHDPPAPRRARRPSLRRSTASAAATNDPALRVFTSTNT